MQESSVRTERRGHLARITLDRPKRLNALDMSMAEAIQSHLDSYREDPAVSIVLIDSSSPRAFCAGGDVRAFRTLIAEEGPDAAHAAMCVPYRMMLDIASFPKPVVTLMDGIAMGGGIGIGAHARHRVVTERSVLAMPETSIGLTPDCGGSWLLARAPGAQGLRLALTGGRMQGEQAVAMGFADHLLPSGTLDRIPDMLMQTAPDQIETALARLATEKTADNETSPLPSAAHVIYELSSLPPEIGLPQLFSRLHRAASVDSSENWERDDLDLLHSASPFSLCVTWRIQQRAKTGSLADAFAGEMRAVRHLIARRDFSEGVRARIIDKDNAPVWSPRELADVDPTDVEACVM